MVYNKTEKIIDKQLLRRQNILKAAREILSEMEMGKVSIKSIAAKAGIATGTFYLYFTDKETLIDTVVQETYGEILETIKGERSRFSDSFDKLQASMAVCVRLFMKERHLAKILLEHLSRHAVLNSKYADIERDLIRLTKIDLDELLEQKRIPEQDTLVSATAFVGSFRQVILSWISLGEPRDWEQAYQTLVDFNMRGLGRDENKSSQT